MSLPPNQKKSQPAWLDIAVFAGVLGFLCLSVQVFLTTRAALSKNGSRVTATIPPPEAPARRAPASQTQALKGGGSTEVLRLPCLQQAGRAFTSDARLLQIHAPACNEDLKQVSTWKGSNETSGEEILVFVNAKEKTLSTSYFSLKDGVNRIVFLHDAGKGPAKVQTIEVSKRSDEP